MIDVTPDEARRLAGDMHARYLDHSDALRSLAAQVERLEAELAETKEGWRLGIEQHRVNVMPETESAVHIAELETEIARLSSGVDRLEAARFAVDTELAGWMDADGPGSLCAIRKLKAENEALRARLDWLETHHIYRRADYGYHPSSIEIHLPGGQEHDGTGEKLTVEQAIDAAMEESDGRYPPDI